MVDRRLARGNNGNLVTGQLWHLSHCIHSGRTYTYQLKICTANLVQRWSIGANNRNGVCAKMISALWKQSFQVNLVCTCKESVLRKLCLSMRLHMAVIMERYVLLILDCQLFYKKNSFCDFVFIVTGYLLCQWKPGIT